MKKILLSISLLFLVGCAESIALLGPASTGAANGKLLQSSIQSAISYGVKAQTGKSPLEHALNYSENNKGSEKVKVKKQKKTTKYTNCVPFLEPVSTDMCTKIKNKISKLSGINNLN